MNGSLLCNCALVNRFFGRRVSIISSLGRRIVKPLGLNPHPFLVSTNCLVLTDTIGEALPAISVVFAFYRLRILLRNVLARRSPIY